MHAPLRAALMTLAILALSGCDQFTQATPEDCARVVDHTERLQAKEAVGDNVVGDIAGKLMKEAKAKAGLRDEGIEQCRGWMKKSDVRCWLKAETMAQAKACKK